MSDAIVTSNQSYYLAPAAQLNTVLAAYQAKKDFIEKVLRKDVDYGTVPGATKPALFKPGAEKMSSFFGLAPVFEDIETVEDWTGEQHGGESFFYYRQRCTLHLGDRSIGSADGSCNSWEKKYRYRQQSRVCPNCGKETIIKGKAEYGGGWICFTKKGGCGAKFKDGDAAIESQQVGQVKNEDIAEQVNTVLKMAQKRALVAAVLISTGVSDYFTQDIDDFVTEGEWHESDSGKTTTPPMPEEPPAPLSAKAKDEQEPSVKAWTEWEKLANEAVGLNLMVPVLPDTPITTGQLRGYYKELDAAIKAKKAETPQ
jgi:ribosomal protein L37AE/L43A